MKQKIIYLFLFMAVLVTACDTFEDPAIPEINDFSLTLSNSEGISLSGVWVKAYYTDIKTDFVVDSICTNVLGKAGFISLEPREYNLKAFRDDQEIGTTAITVTKDDSQNTYSWEIDVYVENYDFTVTLVDNKALPVTNRRVALLTSDATPVLLKEVYTDANGDAVFAHTVVGSYLVYVYDENDLEIFTTSSSNVGPAETNTLELLIRRYYHTSDIVITGFVHDPRGSDSPYVGQVSGDGFVHPGQYEYVQLLALKDIDFTVNSYCVVFTNTGSPTEYGWADGIYNATSKKVYQMNLETGSVSKGQYFYVGGCSRMICSYYLLVGSPQLSTDVFWGIDFYANPGGNNNGAAKAGSGLLGNGSGTSQLSVTKSYPDGIAVFSGTNVDETTVPMDAIFFGTTVTYQEFQIPDNDVYSRIDPVTEAAQPKFGQGTNTYLFPVGAQDIGTFIRLGGKVTPTEWLIPRSGSVLVFNMKDYPGASVADIEGSTDCTVFVNN